MVAPARPPDLLKVLKKRRIAIRRQVHVTVSCIHCNYSQVTNSKFRSGRQGNQVLRFICIWVCRPAGRVGRSEKYNTQVEIKETYYISI